jgi:hypothetical protein
MLRRILKFTAIGCGSVLALIIIVRVGSLDGGGDVTSTPERTDTEPRGGDTTSTPERADAQRRVTDAQPRIKVSCDVYATNRVDPIADSEHLHRQIGNTSLTNESTRESLFASTVTSCDMPWFTSAGWFPVERYEPVRAVNVYYRARAIRPRYAGYPPACSSSATGFSIGATTAQAKRSSRTAHPIAVGTISPRA